MGFPIIDSCRHQLSVTDVRALLRLCNQLHVAAPEWEDRKLRLLNGVRELTGADHASATVATFSSGAASKKRIKPHPPGANVVSVIQAGPELRPSADAAASHAVSTCACPWQIYRASARRRTPATGSSSPAWCTTVGDPAARGRTRREHCVHSFLPLSDGAAVACLSIARRPGCRRFSNRERSIVCTLHSEMAWVYHADLMLVSPEADALSRRERETLRHLLSGKGEKQIAADMGVTHNTIHTYVKSLHKHFRVSSRAELLARWVGR